MARSGATAVQRTAQPKAAALALPDGPSGDSGMAGDAGGAPPQCVVEVGEPATGRGNNFSKGVKWSPDGLTLLALYDDAALRLLSTPDSLLESRSSGPQPLEPYAQVQEGGPILDFCFFPSFTWEYPATCGFITSCQGHPIHLREASTGKLCNTYRPYNQVDEVCHAYSLCFSPDCSRILAGFSQYIRVFDVQRPGRQIEDWTLSTRKGKGQKGMIGALSAATESPGIYAAGSYNRSLCVYHQGSRGKPVAWLADREQDYSMGGVTQLEWASEWMLLSGHRKDNWLRAWDLRMASSASEQGQASGMRAKALVHRFPRVTRTHQRFLFNARSGVLCTGDDTGDALLYSLSTLQPVGRITGAHRSSCVSAMLHPRLDAVVTSSGGRRFPDYDVDSSVASASSASPSPARQPPSKRRRGDAAPRRLDNSIRLWRVDDMMARVGAAAAAPPDGFA